jgi:hypothetical protein
MYITLVTKIRYGFEAWIIVRKSRIPASEITLSQNNIKGRKDGIISSRHYRLQATPISEGNWELFLRGTAAGTDH